MDDKKKQIPLRLSDSLWKEIAAWAEDEFRSINGQIEYILTEAVRRRKKNSSGAAADGPVPSGDSP
jgi:hypothetical protein